MAGFCALSSISNKKDKGSFSLESVTPLTAAGENCHLLSCSRVVSLLVNAHSVQSFLEDFYSGSSLPSGSYRDDLF